MAPRLRSASRNTSRNTSINPSRPTTPMEASRPTSSASETARPKKQRRTGPETRVPVDVVEEPERQRERKKATNSPMETVQEQPETSEQPEQATNSTQTVVPEQQQPQQPKQSLEEQQSQPQPQPQSESESAQPAVQQQETQPPQPEQVQMPEQQPAPIPPAPATRGATRARRGRNTGRQTRASAATARGATRQTGRRRAARQTQAVEGQAEQAIEQQPLPAFDQVQAQPQPEPQQATPEQRQEQAQAEVPRLDTETWVEPPLRVPLPTYREQGLKKQPVLSTMQPLGTMPPARILRQVGLAPPLTPPPARQASTKKGGAKAKQPAPAAIQNGANEQPQAASTSAEDVNQSDSSQAEAIIRDVLAREEQLVRITRSKSGKENADGESAPADDQSAGSSVADPRFSAAKFDQVIAAAISQARGRKNHGLEGGLRLIKEEASSDPFVQSVAETAFANSATRESQAAFQTLIRDAIKRFQAEEAAKAADAAASTRSATTSSLSSAKSLDAATFAPTASEEPVSAQAPTKGKAAQAAAPKGKGKGRAGPVESRANSQPESAFERKRKRAEEDPEATEEAIAAKRRALEAKIVTDSGEVEESNLRTQVKPPAGYVWPARWIVPSDDEEPAEQPAGVSTGRKGRAAPKPAAVATSSKRVRKPVIAQPEEIDNIDFCRACNGSGQLLCCDGCVDSFHFTCLDPPMDPESPPEGQWYCPSCAKKGPLGGLAEAMDSVPQSNFQLPEEVRGFFTGVATGDKGEYTEVTELPEGSRRVATRRGHAEELDPLRVRDSKGKVVVCVRCRTTSEGRRPIIKCDYCPCWWHLDCLDPPLASCPHQKPGSDRPGHYWKCPNHIEHELANIGNRARVRRPRNPKFVDIEVLPDSDGESIGEHEKEGTVYRVRERGVILDFITRVKRGHAEREAKAAEAARLAQEQADAGASSAFSGLLPTEQNAVMGLLSIAGQSPVERAGHVLSQLIAGAPPGAFGDATSEIEILRSLQEVVSQRIQALNPASASAN